MTIKAIIKLCDGSVIERLFSSYTDIDEWVTRHKGQFRRMETRYIMPGERRQGRDE